MGSRQHITGVGVSTRLVGRRTLVSLLAGEAQRTADNRPAIYVRALGGGIHLFKDLCSEQTYRVSGPPDYSFRAGTVLPIGSFNGLQGEWISGFPAMGQAGGSELPAALSVRSSGLRVQAPCPQPISGRSYLAIKQDLSFSPDRLYAFLYLDGTYVSDLGFVELPAGVSVGGAFDPVQRVHTLGDVVIMRGQVGADAAILTWDIGASALKVAHIPAAGIALGDLGGPAWPGAGTDMYFAGVSYFGGEQHIQLYKIPVGFEGDVDLLTAAVGPEYVEATGDLTSPAVLYASGRDFQIPSFYSGDPSGIAVPFSDGGAWALGAGRAIINPAVNVDRAGYPGPQNQIVRVVSLPDGNETVGLLPRGPGTPEIQAFPSEWGLAYAGTLSINPGKTEVACYPVNPLDLPATNDKLLRVQIPTATYPGTCPLPYITVGVASNGQLPGLMLARN